jgi:beta-galactosidase
MIRYEQDTFVQKVEKSLNGMPCQPVVFKNVFDNYVMRSFSYVQKQWQKANFLFEGYLDGKVVCTVKKMPSRRSTRLRLRLDQEGQALRADGSDIAVVIAEVTDDEGNGRRLAKEEIVFKVEGEGEIVGDASIGANPRAVEFGSAPVLIRSTLKPGRIIVKDKVLFEGVHAPSSDSLTFESMAPDRKLIYREYPIGQTCSAEQHPITPPSKMTEAEKKKALEEVEKQQTQFGETF